METSLKARCNFRAVRDAGNGKVQTEFQFSVLDAENKPLNEGIDNGSGSFSIQGDAPSMLFEYGDVVTLAHANVSE